MIDFPASPTTGQLFTASGTTWRYDGEKWSIAFTTASSIVYTSDTAPANPSAGTLWWDSVSGQLFIWYVDPNSAEWVAASSSGGIGEAPTDGQAYIRASSAWSPLASSPAIAGNVGRNLLHNGLLNIWQHGTAAVNLNNVYSADRWRVNVSGDVVSFGRGGAPGNVIPNVDEACVYYLGNVFTGNAAANSFNYLCQPIEGVPRLSGKTVTVSFYAACAAGALNLGVSLSQNFGTGGSPSPTINLNGQSVVLSTTWNRYSLTFALPSSAGKTLGTNGNDYTQLNFWYSAAAPNTAISGNVGVQSGNIVMTGIQLEVGAQATALEKPDPQQDLSRCQRFFCGLVADSNQAPSAAATLSTQLTYPVTMRGVPTITFGTVSSTNAGAPSAAPSYASVKIYWVTPTGGGSYMTVPFTCSADL